MRRKIYLYLIFLPLVIYFLIMALISFSLRGVVIMDMKGGMGNQLFQFSAAYSMAKKTGSKLYILNKKRQSPDSYQVHYNKKYLKEILDVKQNLLSFHDDKALIFAHWLVLHPISKLFNEYLFNIKLADDRSFFDYCEQKNTGLIVMNDYFESDFYFKDIKQEILSMIKIKVDVNSLQRILSDIQMNNSVCVHVRRGDFLRSKFFDIYMMGIEYQKASIKLAKVLLDNPKFYVFSDTISIVKEELRDENDLNFIEGISDFETAYVMQNCAHNIIANSTFGWWVAYANQRENHITIAPKVRYKSKFYQSQNNPKRSYWKRALMSSNAFPKEWILLNHENNGIIKILESLKLPEKQAEKILSQVYKKDFDIYSGDGRELNICDDDHGKKTVCKAVDYSNKPTVVTAYYKVKNKYPDSKYDEWMRDFLKIPFNLVVYTDNESKDKIIKQRGKLPMRLVIKDFTTLEHYNLYDKYKAMYLNHYRKKMSPELYIVWAEKIKFVLDAIKKDYFKSEFFVWCDIGIFRDENYLSQSFPQVDRMVHNKIMFQAVRDFNNYEIEHRMVGRMDRDKIGAGVQVGDKASWMIYELLWDKTLKEMINREMDIGIDQRVVSAVYLRYPTLIELIYPSIWYKGNVWWSSLLYFSHRYEDNMRHYKRTW